MANKVFLSEQYRIKIREWAIGLFYAVGGSVIALVQDVMERGELVFDWPTIRKAAISAAVMYLGRTFFKKTNVTTVYNDERKAKAVANNTADENKTVVK